MNFYIKADMEVSSFPIDHKKRVLYLGSCFAENMGRKMSTYKFHSAVNPLGIVYNPGSLQVLSDRISHRKLIKENELQSCQDYECHLDFHSKFNRTSRAQTVQVINQAIEESHAFANEGLNYVILTLGTAYAYHHKSEDRIINNCHKLPASQFERKLLEPSFIIESLEKTVHSFAERQNDLRFIITVSPVRHLRDGWVQNSRSKAHLLTAAHHLADSDPRIDYFPAYEIMMDELRDYRFYGKDLIHPSEEAVDYIWDRFRKSYFSDSTNELIQKIDQVQRDLKHRPFLKEAQSYQKFLATVHSKILALKEAHPDIDFENEEEHIISLRS